LVVGAGALGNEVVKNLALLGVGCLTVLDRDVVELSNLTRSVLFCTPDIDDHVRRRTPKAKLAAARAREINPDVTVAAHVGEIADFGSGAIRHVDLVFSCLDNEMARLELSWVCNRLNKPLVDGGLGLINAASGLVSLFPGADGPCYLCRKGADRRRELLQELQGREDPCGLKERLQREAGIIATTPTMASIVAALQVEIGLRRVTLAPDSPADVGTSCRIVLHPQILLERLTFARSPRCLLHDPASVIREVAEFHDRDSATWSPAALLAECGADGGFLSFDWPMTARAECRGCHHMWEPWLRRARFRAQPCPACGNRDVVETEVVTGIDAASPWATRPLAALGLPAGHIHEVVIGAGPSQRRCHIEVSGDLAEAREETTAR